MVQEHYRSEGQHPAKNGTNDKVAIWAFKPDGWRLYGAVLLVDGQKCFVGVKVDSAKKQNKPDREMLRRAAEIIGELTEFAKGDANG
ncbi:hypothetical protein [Methylobacterium indicum]|uniref:hypothetical protein n=1 Tax=Methylobacterium indicum TaxID=1775910 RepID=UPI000F784B95|nr:hypothetical protein [Methylobacterium indicum]